jgi:hypothetical protein
LNPNVTFTLGNQLTGGPTVDIVLPYASFDLRISAPLYNGNTTYFPLRPAPNDQTYTLGRVFLQEAYVTADYNSRTFNVSQCVFKDNAPQQLVAIPSDLPVAATVTTSNGTSNANGTTTGAATGTDAGTSGSKSLPAGAIAGIVVGAVVVICLLSGILVFFCCPCGFCPGAARRKQKKRPASPVHEIDGKRVADTDPSSTASDSGQASALASEADGQMIPPKFEIAGNPIMHPQELEAEVPMLSGNRAISQRVSGPSTSSGNTTGVSSLGKDTPPQGDLVELHGTGRRPMNGPMGQSGTIDNVVSPTSPTVPSMMQRNQNPDIVVSSPSETSTMWTPSTPIGPGQFGSHFNENWNNHD